MSSVQTQTQTKAGELIGEVRGKRITTTIKDTSPFGVRLSTNYAGEFTGRYTAAQMETVDVTMSRDGTSQYETRIVQTTPEGDFVVITSRGNGKTSGPSTVAYDGEAVCTTQSARLAWLNTSKCWMEGTTNNATGEYQTKFYANRA